MNASLRGLAVVSMMVALAACSGEGASDVAQDNVGEGEDALSTQLVSGAAAVAIEVIPMTSNVVPASKVILAAPSKLKKVFASVKKRPADAAVPRCMPSHRVELLFLDAKGKEISKVDTTCGGFGNLRVAGKSTPIKTTLDYVELSAEPLVPGDALWGINEVEVTQLATHTTKKAAASEVTALVGAIDAEQKIDGSRPLARCMPTYSVVFKRANKDVASTGFICGTGAPPAKLAAPFAIHGATEEADPLAHGAIDLDPRPFVALFPAE